MKGMIHALAGLSAVVALGWTSAKIIVSAAPAYAQEIAVPFTLVQSIHVKSGAEVDRKVSARRSDGTLAEIGVAVPGRFAVSQRLVSFADGSQVTYYDGLRMKTSWPAKKHTQAGDISTFHPSTCLGPSDKLLRRESILGEAVEVIGESSGDFQAIAWVAPRLACMSLEYTVLAGLENPASGKALSLTVGKDPDPNYFRGGADYQEAKPSEADARLRAALGIEDISVEKEKHQALLKVDALYDSRRTKK